MSLAAVAAVDATPNSYYHSTILHFPLKRTLLYNPCSVGLMLSLVQIEVCVFHCLPFGKLSLSCNKITTFNPHNPPPSSTCRESLTLKQEEYVTRCV